MIELKTCLKIPHARNVSSTGPRSRIKKPSRANILTPPLRLVSFALIFTLVMITGSSEAEAKSRKFVIPFGIFGSRDEIICLEDVILVENNDQSLCIAEYNVYKFFFAGISTNSKLVIAHKNENIYYEIPTGSELEYLQNEGFLPNPLPTYSRPILDYLKGYSLWILLAIIGFMYLLVKIVKRQDQRLSGAQLYEVFFTPMLRRVLVAAMLSDGAIDEDERNVIKNVHRLITGIDMTEVELETVIAALMKEQEPVEKALEQVSKILTDNEKKLLVTAAIMVLSADGKVEASEESFLVQVANALSISPEQLNDILSDILQKPSEVKQP
jgi:tellurite resistance protein